MASRKAKWFVRRAEDSAILCTDRLWRHNTGYIEAIKFYASSGRALTYGLRGEAGHAYAVYSGASINCLGEINDKATWESRRSIPNWEDSSAFG